MEKRHDKILLILLSVAVAVFALFPLTDTDIWWHLACAREWVTTWTPVRTPVVNVHECFQQVVAFVYGIGGAQALVIFKAILWGTVFAFFLLPQQNAGKKISLLGVSICVALLFLFRYQLEFRPVVFSLLFLGIYWNILPLIFWTKVSLKKWAVCLVLLVIQWFWCKFQGLYILGPIFATGVFLVEWFRAGEVRKKTLPWGLFPLAMFCVPFLHREGLSLFLYPFGLLDRLLGLSQSAAIFASEIAENRSPVTLLLSGENVLVSLGMIVLSLGSLGYSVVWCISRGKNIRQETSRSILNVVILLVTAALTLLAERNFVLLLPVLLVAILRTSYNIPASVQKSASRFLPTTSIILVAFIFGLWFRSLQAYDRTMVSYQRVPVEATRWMQEHPHPGHLFNDDRAGGYLAFVNPADSIYIDGRFILRTADFFENYLAYATHPERFLSEADSLGIDRALFPLQYYARWDALLQTLAKSPRWHLAYRDDYFVVFDKN